MAQPGRVLMQASADQLTIGCPGVPLSQPYGPRRVGGITALTFTP
jgi:hypothetical protein